MGLAMLRISPIGRLLLTVCFVLPPYIFVISPLQYEIRSLICESHHAQNPLSSPGCSLPEVDAAVAAAIAAVGMLQLITSKCLPFPAPGRRDTWLMRGAMGVITATWMSKRIGLRSTFAFCVLFSTILHAAYVFAVHVRGEWGMVVIYWSQITLVIGGVGGAQMAVTAILSALAEEGSISGVLGLLGGLTTCVAAAAATAGGYAYDWHRQAPFVLASIWTIASSIIIMLLVPDVPVVSQQEESRALDVIRIFAPRKIERRGREHHDWSLAFAGIGASLSIIATSYTSTELNIVGMNQFGVTPQEMGTLSAWLNLSKGIFLILLFPRLSKAFFRYVEDNSGENQPLLDSETHSERPRKRSADLYLLFAAIMLELAAVTGLAFSTQKWHLFVLSTFVPNGAGVGALVPAVILHFVPPEKRPEGVAASQLLDKFASTTAILLFGYVFAWLSKLELGKLVFLANGVVGILALLALLCVRHH